MARITLQVLCLLGDAMGTRKHGPGPFNLNKCSFHPVAARCCACRVQSLLTAIRQECNWTRDLRVFVSIRAHLGRCCRLLR